MSKKFTIAFQLTNFLEEYPRLLLAGATDAAKELDVNLFVFQTEAFDIPFDYRYQSNLLFEFLNDREFDFLILSSSSLLNFISASEFEEKIKKLQGKNIISLGIPLKNAYAIVVENRKATFEATTHY
jgi:DNA-binding LacI/PurR family transcriptional regulator